MSIKEIIIKGYNEGDTIENLAETYGDLSCVAEEFSVDCPKNCSEDGSYCEECWINKVTEIIEENLR